MVTLNINLKDKRIIPFVVHNDDDTNNIITRLFLADVENRIETISILPMEKENKEYDKERYIQCYY